MAATAAGSHADRDPIEVMAESFLERYRRGERPSIDDYAAQHPELAEEIRELLPALVRLEQGMSVSGEATGSHHTQIRAETLAGAPRHLGDYTILREVGRGGMGVVYEAVQQSLGRHVALKVLPWHQIGESSLLRRFQLEARSAARLHHTNIVPVFGVGEDQGVHYYAMQFIHGQGLDVVIGELRRLRNDTSSATEATMSPTTAASIAQGLISGRIIVPTAECPSDSNIRGTEAGASPGPTRNGGDSELESARPSKRSALSTDPPFFREAARIGLQVADGLAHAHAQGILHRDVKPSNLLMDTRGTVWISDFGLAKTEGSDGPTRTGDIVGTLRYMAPERFDGLSDRRSDVYSLGATLYEMITLEPLHGECDRARLVDRILCQPPKPPRSIDPRIPRDLETIVLKALEKEPRRRYASAADLAADLERFVDGRAISARPVPPWERLSKWARRHPTIAMLTMAVHLLLVTLLGIGVWSYLEIGRSLELARTEGEKAKRLAETEASARAEAQRQAERARTQGQVAEQRADDLAWEDYVSRVDRALREIQDDNVALAEDLLHGCPAEYRGWEWHYVKRLCSLERLELEPGNVNALAAGPDGTWLVSATGPFTAFAPRPTAEGIVERWDLTTGGRHLLGRHRGNVFSLAISPDGSRVAVGHGVESTPSYTGVVTLRDARTGEPVWSVEESGHVAMSVTFSPDGTRLAVGFGFYSSRHAGRIRILDAATGEDIATLPGPPGGVNRVAFHPDGRRLASAGLGIAEIWDVEARKKVLGLPGHFQWVYCLAFSPDGRWLATGGWDRTVRIWDTETGEERRLFSSHRGFVLDLAFSLDGKYLVSTGEDRSVRLWEIPSGREAGSLHGHTDFVQAVAFMPDGRSFATGSMDGTLRLWDRDRGRPVVVEHGGWPGRIAFRRDGLRVFSEVANLWTPGPGRITRGVWDPSTGAIDPEWSGVPLDDLPDFGPVVRMWTMEAVSPDGRLEAEISRRSGHGNTDRSKDLDVSSVQLREVTTGRLIHTLIGHTADVVCLAFSPDGRRLATASFDRTVKLWDVATGRDVFTLRGHTAGVISLAFSPDGSRLVSGSVDWTARVWDASPLSSETLDADENAYREKRDALALLSKASTASGRAQILARAGEWGLATSALEEAIREVPDDETLRFALALCLAQIGDKDRYRSLCAELIALAGKETEEDTAGRLARSLVLLPDATGDPNAVVDLIVSRFATPFPVPASHRDHVHLVGPALYRAGRIEEAVRWSQSCAEAHGGEGNALDQAFLTMAHHRLGHAEEAGRWLEALRKSTPDFDPSSDRDQTRINWDYHAHLLLRREAEALNQSRDGPAPPGD